MNGVDLSAKFLLARKFLQNKITNNIYLSFYDKLMKFCCLHHITEIVIDVLLLVTERRSDSSVGHKRLQRTKKLHPEYIAPKKVTEGLQRK